MRRNLKRIREENREYFSKLSNISKEYVNGTLILFILVERIALASSQTGNLSTTKRRRENSRKTYPNFTDHH
jgi:hypothetical protein